MVFIGFYNGFMGFWNGFIGFYNGFMGFQSGIIGFYNGFMGFQSGFIGFYNGFMGFQSGLMMFNGILWLLKDLVGFNGMLPSGKCLQWENRTYPLADSVELRQKWFHYGFGIYIYIYNHSYLLRNSHSLWHYGKSSFQVENSLFPCAIFNSQVRKITTWRFP